MLKVQRFMKILVYLVLMTAFIGCASTSQKASTGEYVDDSVITTKVKAEIFGEPTLKTLQVNVETFKGTVQLSGFVDSQHSIHKAEEVARRVKGVVAVKNDLVVK